MKQFLITGMKLFCLLSIFMMACTAAQPVSTSALPRTPLNTLSLIKPSIEATNTEPIIITSTLTPSVTASLPHPTATHLPIYETTTADVARASTETEIASFSPKCSERFDGTLLSPKGTWLAISCGYSKNQTLEVIDHKRDQWILKIENFMSKEKLQDGKFEALGSLYPLFWTSDEQYLYFTSFTQQDGGGICYYGFGDAGLFRLRLSDGKVSTILPITAFGGGYLYAFSPTGRRLIYNYFESGQIVILDLQTGDETYIDVGNNQVGDFVWSQDGLELAYASCRMDLHRGIADISFINLYSIEDHTTKIILESAGHELHINAQDANHILLYNDDYRKNEQPIQVLYNWFSNQLATLTPTP